MKSLIFILIIFSVYLPSCNKKSKAASNEIKQIIIEKYENMRVTLKKGDSDYVLNMHTKDAILYLPSGKEIVGIIELRPFYEKVAATGIDIKSIPTKVELLTDDVAFEVGIFTSTSKTGARNSAKYINIWRKVDGDWKICKAIDQAKL
jgi:ketosteroid isomerase-like protein